MKAEVADTEVPTATVQDVVEGWLASGYVDGVFRKFQREFPVLGDAEIEDAVGSVTEKILARTTPAALRCPNAYLVVAVRNTLRRTLRRIVPDELPEDDANLAVVQTADEQLLALDLLNIVRKTLATWPNRQMAVVTLAYVEAAYYDEPIDPETIQQIVLDTLDDEITRTNVSTLLNRGRTRLMKQLADKI